MSKDKSIIEKDLPHICKFCELAIPLIGDTYMLCRKFGTVEIQHSCRRFLYDPLKHIPSPPLKILKPNDEELLF